MDLGKLDLLLELARNKLIIDRSHSWSNGSSTYFEELKKELVEVEIEMGVGRKIFLEDELGDILWDYFNLLVNLENENRIDLKKVFTRVNKKYSERISSIENDELWEKVKKKQKEKLKLEQEKLDKSSKW